MSFDWREQLLTLLPQFQANAVDSCGLNHLMVENARNEDQHSTNPPPLKRPSESPKIVNSEIIYDKWEWTSCSHLPSVQPYFREPYPEEVFDDDDDQVVRDKNKVVRAVCVRGNNRTSFFCGQGSDKISKFESLANMAANILKDTTDLSDHFMSSELTDLFRKPRGGVRYVFGEVPVEHIPRNFIARGWACGVLQFNSGVLIDAPIAESAPDHSHWLLLLHRIGWRAITGCPLTAYRAHWKVAATLLIFQLPEGDLSMKSDKRYK